MLSYHTLYVLILNLFFISVILYLGYVIYNPNLIIRYLKHKFSIQPDNHSITHENIKEEMFSTTVQNGYKKNFKHKIYYYTKPKNNPHKLIIDIPGGAFVVAATNLNLYFNMLHLDIDVVSIEYPALMEATAEDTLLYLEEAVHYIIKNHKKKYFTEANDNDLEIYLVTASAGSYFGTKLINRGNVKNITKFIGINGYYGHRTMSNGFYKILENYYLTQTLFDNAKQRKYDCRPIDSTIESMIIMGKQDTLKESSINFSKLTGRHLDICTYEGDHTFYHKWNTLEAKRFYNDLELFLLENFKK